MKSILYVIIRFFKYKHLANAQRNPIMNFKYAIYFFQKHLFRCLFFFIPQYAQVEHFTFPDFDQALMRHGITYLYPCNSKPTLIHSLPFKHIYKEAISHFNDDPLTPCRIPKVVHQIWLGSPVPEKYKNWMNAWLNMQGWEYKLWTDKEVEHLNLYNKNLYEKAENYGEKGDILRYEILLKEGGLYVDTDFELINQNLLEQFNKSFDFYIGFEPMEHVIDYERKLGIHIKMSTALIASIPNHPILKKLVTDMADNYLKYTYIDPTAPKHMRALNRTGPNYLTKTLTEYNKNSNDNYINLFCPPTFFCPITCGEEEAPLKYPLKGFIKPETAAIHHWAGSWIN
jgi:mannosyltransferase OCH1-like enzyme